MGHLKEVVLRVSTLTILATVLGASSPCWAAPLQITAGRIAIEPDRASFVLEGDGGFSYRGVSNGPQPALPCGDTNPCAAGSRIDVDGTWGMRLGERLASASWSGADAVSRIAVSSSFQLPIRPGPATSLQIPFMLSGELVDGPDTIELRGAGIATVWLAAVANAGSWFVQSIDCDLGGRLPAPWADDETGGSLFGAARWIDGTLLLSTRAVAKTHGEYYESAYRDMAGAGTIRAKVRFADEHTSQSVNDMPRPLVSTIGVTLRESLDPLSARVGVELARDGTISLVVRHVAGEPDMLVTSARLATAEPWLSLTRIGGEVVASYSADGTAWAELGRVATGLATTDVVAGFQLTAESGTTASALFDDIFFIDATPRPNLLLEGDFEGYPTPALGPPGWLSDDTSQTPARSDRSQPHTGLNAGACRATERLDCGLFQEAVATITGTYSLRLYAAADRPGGVVGASLNGFAVASSEVQALGGGRYARYVMTFEASAGDIIRVWMYSPPRSGSLTIDDAFLVALEPETPGCDTQSSTGAVCKERQSAVALQAAGDSTLTLINADTDQPISGFDPIGAGAEIHLDQLPTRNLNVRANTSPAVVGSVRFDYDSVVQYRAEGVAPYALAGDNNGDYNAWTPTPGSHTVTATPFSGAGLTGTAGTPVTVTFVVSDTPVPPSTHLIGAWPFDEGSGVTAGDVSGQNRPGTLVNAPAWVAGRIGPGALQFNGSDNYVLLPLITTATTNVSIAAWVKWDGRDLHNQAIVYNGLGSSSGYGLYASNGSCGAGHLVVIQVGGQSCNATASSAALIANRWTYVAMTRDGSSWRLYVDGVLQGSASDAPPAVPTSRATIGGSASGDRFPGAIDDVRFFDIALSASDVQQLFDAANTSDTTPPTPPTTVTATAISASQIDLTWAASSDASGIGGYRVNRNGALVATTAGSSTAYSDCTLAPATTYSYTIEAFDASPAANRSAPSAPVTATTFASTLPSGLVGHWPLDESAGTTVSDASGGSHPGTAVNGPTWTAGVVGPGALSFDGSDDHVLVSGLAVATANVSMSVWVRWDGRDLRNHQILYAGVGSRNGFGLYASNKQCAAGHVVVVQVGGVSCDATASSVALTANRWTHLVVTRDMSNWRLYADGVLQGSRSGSAPVKPDSSVTFGGSTTGDRFPGAIDDVRIYDHALSTTEVQQLFALGGGDFVMPPPVLPGSTWVEATPESQGIDSAKLQVALDYLRDNSDADGIHELVIVRNGRIIAHGDDIDNVHGIRSMTKVATNLMLGLLRADGKASLDTAAKNYDASLSQSYASVTLRHFATMTSGYRALGDSTDPNSHGQGLTPFAPDTPLFSPPGSAFAYWDSAANEYANVLTKIAGEPLQELYRRRIAGPIGMNPNAWSWDNLGTVNGLLVNAGAGNLGALRVSAREFARIGLLFMNRGAWGATQVVPMDWVDASTAPQVSASLPLGNCLLSNYDGRGVYGYGWWANGFRSTTLYDANCQPYAAPSGRYWTNATSGTFWATGYNNKLFVMPEWKMIIVRLNHDDEQVYKVPENVYNTFLGLVAQSIFAY